MNIDSRLHRIVASKPYPLLFAAISGAHLYGFPSPDTEFDLRGAHVLPLEQIVGLEVRDETSDF
jgi:predicted nucleotidyltransferase